MKYLPIESNKIVNIRYGLATNSSSVHSIIYNPEVANMSDEETFKREFGWDFFTLKTRAERKEYMLQILKGHLPNTVIGIIKKILTERGQENIFLDLFSGYVDHGYDHVRIPKDIYNVNINMDFFNEYYDYILNNNFIIIGGNDNTEEKHHLKGTGTKEKESYTNVIPYDSRAYKNGNYWVVFNKDKKIRINFNDEQLKPKYPELIDLKITDYCDKGCAFCYQGSTKNGKHAIVDDIYSYLVHSGMYDNLIDFALGGGEPTEHPEFKKILTLLSKRGRNVINFTTKSTKWMEDEDTVEIVKDTVSGIAYSPDTIMDAIFFVNKHDFVFKSEVDLYLHIIPELWNQEELLKFIEHIEFLNSWKSERIKNLKKVKQIKITLLGYKEVERGKDYSDNKITFDIKNFFKNVKNVQVGIDTKIANDFKKELNELNIDDKLYTVQEGEFSMYIDAVENRAYKSSYQLDEYVDIKKNKKISAMFEKTKNMK